MRKLRISKKTYLVPETVEEVPASSWRGVAFGLVQGNRVITFCELCGIPWKVGRLLTEEQWLYLFPAMDWLHTLNSERQPVPFVRIGDEKYYLPADGMEFSPMIEFVMAEDALWRYIYLNDSGAVAEMFFTLCRPRNQKPRNSDWDGDVRERYNAALVSARAKAIKPPAWALYLVMLYFSGVKHNLRERYPELFSHGEKKEEEEDEQQPESPAVGWLKVLKALAEKGLYGNYESVCYTFMHTVMLNLVFDTEKDGQTKTT